MRYLRFSFRMHSFLVLVVLFKPALLYHSEKHTNAVFQNIESAFIGSEDQPCTAEKYKTCKKEAVAKLFHDVFRFSLAEYAEDICKNTVSTAAAAKNIQNFFSQDFRACLLSSSCLFRFSLSSCSIYLLYSCLYLSNSTSFAITKCPGASSLNEGLSTV